MAREPKPIEMGAKNEETPRSDDRSKYWAVANPEGEILTVGMMDADKVSASAIMSDQIVQRKECTMYEITKDQYEMFHEALIKRIMDSNPAFESEEPTMAPLPVDANFEQRKKAIHFDSKKGELLIYKCPLCGRE